MRVKMDRNIHRFTQCFHQLCGRKWLAESGHILHGQHVGAEFLQLLCQIHVVGERIFPATRVQHVACVADRCLANSAALQHGINRNPHVWHPVQRVEHPEDIDAALGRLFHEGLHHVVWVVGVADGVTGAQEHLKEDVWNSLSQLTEAIPWALLQKAHRGVERGPSPHLKRKKTRCESGVGIGNSQHVEAAHAGRQERLMRISHRCVGEE